MRATQWRTRDIGVVRVRLEERENITVTAENHLRRLRAVAIDHLREEQKSKQGLVKRMDDISLMTCVGFVKCSA